MTARRKVETEQVNGGLETRVEYITPEIAQRYLSKRPATQRAIRPAKVAQYAADMRDGRWSLTHQGIAFDAEGRLVDGQHRLSAVVKAGVAVDVLVTRGVGAEAFVGMDRGMLRAAYDNAPEPWMASRGLVAVARGAMLGYDGLYRWREAPRPTDWQTFVFMGRHREALEKVSSAFTRHRTGVGQAMVQAAFLRASYHVPEDFLFTCASVLIRGILPDESYSGMEALRVFLTARRNRGGGGNFQLEVFAKTERALALTRTGEKVYRLRAPSEELFPLPDIV